MKPPSTMPLSEQVKYYGVDAVNLDELIVALENWEEYENGDYTVEELEEENAKLTKDLEELEEENARQAREIYELTAEANDLKDELRYIQESQS